MGSRRWREQGGVWRGMSCNGQTHFSFDVLVLPYQGQMVSRVNWISES